MESLYENCPDLLFTYKDKIKRARNKLYWIILLRKPKKSKIKIFIFFRCKT